jgi:hypothetical protein
MCAKFYEKSIFEGGGLLIDIGTPCIMILNQGTLFLA